MFKKRPMKVRIIYEDGYSIIVTYPDLINKTLEDGGEPIGGEWISLPEHITDDEAKWVFNQLSFNSKD